jgi:pyruvate/2-oxoglutarate dehydrogenase complex dihydrolipoamide dehydrogenase (E3) component
MFDDRVVCALHGASFHVQTGDQLTFPGDDGVPKYEVVTEGSKSYVVVPEGGLKAQKRESKMVKRDHNDSRNFVIIGGGAAGLKCAENLRKSGYTGKITMISPETILPYDRTLLSKALPVGDSNKFTLRCKGFMKRADIDIIEDRVYSIHTDVKKVTFARKGDPMDYDKILIATGGEPRKPDVKGVKAKNVFVLRSNTD